MKFLIQRVQKASVTVDNQVIGCIGKGFLVFIGVTDTDTRETADKMLQKMINLRIFEDENGKTNLDIKTVEGSLLLISQFTLYADCRKGNRPSFINAGLNLAIPSIVDPNLGNSSCANTFGSPFL